MKKNISFLLVIAVLISFWNLPVFAADEAQGGIVSIGADDKTVTVNEVTYTVVRNAEELAAMSAGGTYILANDINGTGTVLSAAAFSMAAGTVLDGNGFALIDYQLESTGSVHLLTLMGGEGKTVIRNLSFGTAEKPISVKGKGVGLVADAANTDVNWESVTFHVKIKGLASGNNGGVISVMNGTHNFTGCTMNVQLIDAGAWCCGGWVGQLQQDASITMRDCVTRGSIETAGKAGGFVGNKKGDVTLTGCVNEASVTTGLDAGGFVGYMDNQAKTMTLTDCLNYGSITGNQSGGAAGVGGFAGRDVTQSTYINCKNYGSVTGKKSTSGTDGMAGGIIGDKWGVDDTQMEACINYGTISGGNHIGGMIGRINMSATLHSCVNYGVISDATNNGGGMVGGSTNKTNKTLSITSCINFGNITASTTAGFVATGSGTVIIRNSFNAGTLNGSSHTGGFFGWIDLNSCTLEECANIGAIVHTGANNVGNFAGVLNSAGASEPTITDCYAFGSIQSSSQNIGILLGSGSNAKPTVEGIRYLAVKDSSSTIGTAEEDMVTVEEAAELMEAMFDAYRFLPGEGGIPVVANPVLRAVQETVPSSQNLQRVRFIATMQTLNYDYIGFHMKKIWTDGETGEQTEERTEYCTHAYTQVAGVDEAGSLKKTNASDLYGTYLYALVVNDVPTDTGTVTFEMTPFAVKGETEYLGETISVVYINGEYMGYTVMEGGAE